jgi:hypothetical protein
MSLAETASKERCKATADPLKAPYERIVNNPLYELLYAPIYAHSTLSEVLPRRRQVPMQVGRHARKLSADQLYEKFLQWVLQSSLQFARFGSKKMVRTPASSPDQLPDLCTFCLAFCPQPAPQPFMPTWSPGTNQRTRGRSCGLLYWRPDSR